MVTLIEKLHGSVNYQNQLTMLSEMEHTLSLIKKQSLRVERKLELLCFDETNLRLQHQLEISQKALRRLLCYYRKQQHNAIKMPVI